jgi:hypothetical protein
MTESAHGSCAGERDAAAAGPLGAMPAAGAPAAGAPAAGAPAAGAPAAGAPAAGAPACSGTAAVCGAGWCPHAAQNRPAPRMPARRKRARGCRCLVTGYGLLERGIRPTVVRSHTNSSLVGAGRDRPRRMPPRHRSVSCGQMRHRNPVRGAAAHHQLIVPCFVVSTSSPWPALNRNASRFLVRKLRACGSITLSP